MLGFGLLLLLLLKPSLPGIQTTGFSPRVINRALTHFASAFSLRTFLFPFFRDTQQRERYRHRHRHRHSEEPLLSSPSTSNPVSIINGVHSSLGFRVCSSSTPYFSFFALFLSSFCIPIPNCSTQDGVLLLFFLIITMKVAALVNLVSPKRDSPAKKIAEIWWEISTTSRMQGRRTSLCRQNHLEWKFGEIVY